ncbi:MAG: hypothetical protein V1907_00435 [Candidatus Kerfeldbacteria bacterium]
MIQRIAVFMLYCAQLGLFIFELVAKYDTHGRQVALAITNVVSVALFIVVQYIVRRRYGIVIHWIVLLIISASVWLDAMGNFLHFYGSIWWWDRLTHAVGGLAVTTGFFVVTISLWRAGRMRVSWFVVNLYAFCLAQTLGALYEVSEWIGDTLFVTHRIGNGFDTPRDLFFNMLGGLIALAVAYLWRMRYRAVNTHAETRH